MYMRIYTFVYALIRCAIINAHRLRGDEELSLKPA